jgi:uncharacterized protein YydD (DUF2326 family)
MKLSKLYSNKPDIFEPVSFNYGLNVVMAEIRLPENKKKDTHNLGKTTLGRLLDFCLLSSRDNRFFLFKHFDLFKNFVFFLELELLDGSYVTIRRGVEQASRISFKRDEFSDRDFTSLADEEWDHIDIALERARDILDGLLDLRALNQWSFRKGLGYLLRSQDDFSDVFHLSKFQAAHSDWKPYLAHILGFDAAVVKKLYDKETELSQKLETAQTVQTELGGSVEDISKVEGILLLKQKEAEKKQRLLDAFDFRSQDKEKLKNIVDELDERINRLNAERYVLTQNRKKIIMSLKEDEILFSPNEAKKLFQEAGVLFEGQIKRDFEQLIDFNKAITEERRVYLAEEQSEIEAELKRVGAELNELGKKRSQTLAFLTGTDTFVKYKMVSDELVAIKADIASLERQRGFLRRLQELRKDIRSISDEKEQLQTQIEENVETQNSDVDSLFSSIRLFFSEIVEEVIDRKALLKVWPNQMGHLEFRAEILDEQECVERRYGSHLQETLCIAFDLAVLRAHAETNTRDCVSDGYSSHSMTGRKGTYWGCSVDTAKAIFNLSLHLLTLICLHAQSLIGQHSMTLKLSFV